jgi:hypothetical protein
MRVVWATMVVAVQSSCARQRRPGHCFRKHRRRRGEGQGGLGVLQGLGAARVGRRHVLGTSARCHAVAGNQLPRGACELGRGGIRAEEGDRAVAAGGWWAATTAGLVGGELTDWLVWTRRWASRGAWGAGAGRACGVHRAGVRQGHGVAGRGGNAGHKLGA